MRSSPDSRERTVGFWRVGKSPFIARGEMMEEEIVHNTN